MLSRAFFRAAQRGRDSIPSWIESPPLFALLDRVASPFRARSAALVAAAPGDRRGPPLGRLRALRTRPVARAVRELNPAEGKQRSGVVPALVLFRAAQGLGRGRLALLPRRARPGPLCRLGLPQAPPADHRLTRPALPARRRRQEPE